jgi:hypothetical protein
MGKLSRILRQAKTTEPENQKLNMDTITAYLSQVSLALLIIFVMISIMFRSNYATQLEGMKKGWMEALEKLEKFENTPVEVVQKKLEATEEEKQRLEILRVIDLLDGGYRQRFGLTTFKYSGNGESNPVEVSSVLFGENVVDQEFVRASKEVKEVMEDGRDTVRFKEAWDSALLEELKSRGIKEENLTDNNKRFLVEEIARRVTSLCGDTVSLQTDVLSYINTYYNEHLEGIQGNDDLDKAAERLSALSDQKLRGALVQNVLDLIDAHVKSVLEKNGVVLVPDAWRKIK